MSLTSLLKVLALLSHKCQIEARMVIDLQQEMDPRNRWRKDLIAFGPNLLLRKPVPKKPSCRGKAIDLRFPWPSCS
ncbi:hypothetical protein AMTRI_Chr03g139020 [Amborella trichopoda]